MDDIDIIPRDNLTKIVVALHILISFAFGLFHLAFQALGIDIAESQKSPGHRQVSITNSTTTENGASQFIRWSRLAIQTEHAARHDGNRSKGSKTSKGLSSGNIV